MVRATINAQTTLGTMNDDAHRVRSSPSIGVVLRIIAAPSEAENESDPAAVAA